MIQFIWIYNNISQLNHKPVQLNERINIYMQNILDSNA